MAAGAALRALLASFLLASLCALCHGQAFYTGTDVVELTASTFRTKVLEDDHVWMIEFYAPWCGHCQRLKPDYIKAATASKGIVRFGAIDCDVHKSIAQDYGVRGFPTLKLFGTNKKRSEDYNGARTPKAMADAALALLPNHVTLVSAKSHADFLAKNAELPKALLFTAKSSTTALYKALALDLKGRMALGEVRAKKDAALLSEYKVEESELPVLLVLPLEAPSEDGEEAGASGSAHPKYEGELKHKPLLKFLSQYTKPKPGKGDKEGASKAKAEKEKASPPKAPAAPSVAQLASSADVEAKCLKVKGFCVLALLAGDLKDEVAKLEKLEEKYHKDPLKFSWLDATKAPALESLFVTPAAKEEGEGKGPALVLLSPKRGKFTLHWGFEGLESLLDRAIGGDVSLESKVEDGWHKALDSA